MSITFINPFCGRLDSEEDPEEYLDDINYALSKKGDEREVSDRDRCVLFRQNLRDNARTWYSYLLPQEKNDWNVLQRLFRTRYGIDDIDKRFRQQIAIRQILLLRQDPDESMDQYLQRAAALEARVLRTEAWPTMGTCVARGLHGDDTRRWVLRELAIGEIFTFKRALEVIISMYGNLGDA
ncbi:hypothetical protein N8T08_001222 [Aspergillus melleus]|uniref:Uncharacterized protein n=1 Tax=Aspergillus melleus TaxID=138277 RepID=A0ACC3ANK4_9EURO|nr:hypothetical protein N8T08_001222 [Aspergillus melleus]